METHNKNLASTANKAGVTNYANFTDAGYIWLYGWLRQTDIHKAKKLNKDEKILDHMSSEELAANLFRATQTEAKIRREEIKWQDKASLTHYEIGKKVRKTIEEIWGTMPEQLPAVEHIKIAEKRVKSTHKKISKKK
jgi:DNA-damage-inducible protein D